MFVTQTEKLWCYTVLSQLSWRIQQIRQSLQGYRWLLLVIADYVNFVQKPMFVVFNKTFLGFIGSLYYQKRKSKTLLRRLLLSEKTNNRKINALADFWKTVRNLLGVLISVCLLRIYTVPPILGEKLKWKWIASNGSKTH